MAALLAAAKAADCLHTAAADASQAVASVLIPSLRSLRLLMQLPDCRGTFLNSGGPELLLQLLQDCCKALSGEGQQQPEQQLQQYQLAGAVAALAEAASWQDEEGKCM